MRKLLLSLVALLWGLPAWGQNLPPGTMGVACLPLATPAAVANQFMALTCDLSGGLRVNGTARSAGTNRSAVVGTTAVVLIPTNPLRQGWKIKNDSTGDLWINFDATATAAPGGGNIRIPAGTYLASEPAFVETGAMSAIGSAAALSITAREH